MAAITENNEADFFTLQEFFHHQLSPRQQSGKGSFRLGLVLRDDDTLTGGQSIRFENDRIVELAKPGACVFEVGDHKKPGRGNSSPRHKLLTETLASLQLSGRG